MPLSPLAPSVPGATLPERRDDLDRFGRTPGSAVAGRAPHRGFFAARGWG